jgi:preprotein translocase subunit SecA
MTSARNIPLRPGIRLGDYPEREAPRRSWLDIASAHVKGLLAARKRLQNRDMRRFIEQVEKVGEQLAAMNTLELRERISLNRQLLRRDGLTRRHTIMAFAVIREVAHRTLGMRHFDVQLLAGRVLLRGMLAEMETGEGKTLTATLPACTAALAGIPVHVITVNEYLVSRDAANMRPIYDYLGLSVGCITEGMDEAARRAAYAADITYCTNKQVAFDYLRDRIVLRHAPGQLSLHAEKLRSGRKRLDQVLMRGLCYAIVDEADSVLIDEAGTPLVISQGGQQGTVDPGPYHQAHALVERLQQDTDYVVTRHPRAVQLTDNGKSRLEELAAELGGPWTLRTRREELVSQALAAQYLFKRDREYLVKDNRVMIIDDSTGRIMADRSWERGLHQMIEAKEGCDITPPNEVLARLSYQRFFRRYLHLSGMTGTARETAGELNAVYGLKTRKIPTHRPSKLSAHPGRMLGSAGIKWQTVIQRVSKLHGQARPVLVGTRTVADSEHLSELLTRAGIPHQVLNARQDSEEARLVARAGRPGCITIATNMAGRGTDIPLAPGVPENGGLHVIAVEPNQARRIDRQLFGRCARQGAPGSFETILSLEDEVIQRFIPKYLRSLAAVFSRGAAPLPGWMGAMITGYCQRKSERQQRSQRKALERADEHIRKTLAFTGQSE